MINNNLKKEQFQSILFEAEKTSSRVSSAELSHFIDDENELKDMIGRRKLLYQKDQGLTSTGAYEKLEDLCQINMDTMKKTISGRIRITRNFIYKFAVGLHMALEEANEYFELNGGVLNERCMADYICIKALKDHDDVHQFIKDFERHTGIKIAMRNRQSK